MAEVWRLVTVSAGSQPQEHAIGAVNLVLTVSLLVCALLSNGENSDCVAQACGSTVVHGTSSNPI
jgi:hypothetical protein